MKISILEGLLFRDGNSINLTVRSAGLSMRKRLKAVNPTVVPLIWFINMETYGQIHHQTLFILSTTGSNILVLKNIIFSMNITFIVSCSVSLSMSISKSKDIGACDWNKIREVINI